MSSAVKNITTNTSQSQGVPLPVVKLTRWILLLGILAALIGRQPLITTLLLIMLLLPLIRGERWSLPIRIGKWFFGSKFNTLECEDEALSRFNNAIAVFLLFLAQVAFVCGVSLLGWTLALLVVLAAVAGLAGYCVGCSLFFQYNQLRHKLEKYR
jgi:hypothetical protein